MQLSLYQAESANCSSTVRAIHLYIKTRTGTITVANVDRFHTFLLLDSAINFERNWYKVCHIPHLKSVVHDKGPILQLHNKVISFLNDAK